ncbi:hypothetical protein BGL34_03870 [Fructilactobacillus lindneri]|uniref:VTT domain-containing protein n=2 Tax=Fructilactobacillus lindneri TaxID=53444 RepID=A0A0R2JNT3_9LACO|nr:VTT domain-containing protein [Fructilactobacillus lindneri]ANZ57741.1 hypothetical protein AYR60_02670 [Fructilactobacillus lindneri]ANZ59010.1 hypothetical protein AYR59_02670 [Fructilactobacillus lindneri]KRN78819.1 hypothetical protein IV52_GL001099 [Fructilactobacillus lindneri DSM 20690 = JCM 11027]POG98037.1 hypothetical protein BGL31_04885 [Fructilactobacillus lindneri]POG99066.1 hypothetical protein BGL32_05900 [Fructilactobacillus lindneri]
MNFIKTHRITIFKIAAALIGVLLLYILFKDYQPQIEMLFNPKERPAAIHAIRSQGLVDVVLLMLLLYIGTSVPGIPVMPIAVLSGLCFGVFWGTLINVISIGAGNIASIKLISFFKKDAEKKYKNNKYSRHLKRIKNPLTQLLVGYSIPMIPSYLVSLEAAAEEKKYSPKIVMLTAVLGTFPVALIYALGGNTILKGSLLQVIILLIIIVLFLFAANWLLKMLVTDKI